MRGLRFAGPLFYLWTSVVCAFAAADSSNGSQLLSDSAKLVHLRDSGSYRFQMEGSFRAQINVPQDGHFTLKWGSKDLWSLSLKMGDFQQLEVKKGEWLYTKRNLSFTPLPLTEFLNLIDVFDADPKDWKVKKLRQRSKNGALLQCVEVQPISKGPKNEICLDPATLHVVSVESRDDVDFERDEFSEYLSFHEHQYPARLKHFQNGSLVLNVHISSLVDANLDDSSFVAPDGAIARRRCAGMTHPVPTETPDPQYPAGALQNGIMGTSTVALTVLPDGSVTDIQLVGSAEHEMDAMTLATLKTWRFKPACAAMNPRRTIFMSSSTFASHARERRATAHVHLTRGLEL